MERDNRKSHLAPQLSPATQDLLRSGDSPTTSHGVDDRALRTPTSGEIPIMGTMITPRNQHSSVQNHRSPAARQQQPGGAGRPGGPPEHPGLGGPRLAATDAVPRNPRAGSQQLRPLDAPTTLAPAPAATPRPTSAGRAIFALPVRPAPPGGSLPPPPPPKSTQDKLGRDSHRQVAFGAPVNGTTGDRDSSGYPLR